MIDPDPEEIPGIDVTGNILPNKEINVRFTISGSTGITEYQEVHTTKTDEYGMINLVIGKGNSVTGKFTEIYWDGSTKNLKVEINWMGLTQTLVIRNYFRALRISEISLHLKTFLLMEIHF